MTSARMLEKPQLLFRTLTSSFGTVSPTAAINFNHYQSARSLSSLLSVVNKDLNFIAVADARISLRRFGGVLCTSIRQSSTTRFQNVSLQPTAAVAVVPSQTEPDELLAGFESFINAEEIVARQQNLMQITVDSLKRSATFSQRHGTAAPIILIVSNPGQFQANTSMPVNECKQNSDFTYFTGLHSGSSDQMTSDCVLAMFREHPDRSESLRSVIFSPTRTKSEQLWNGPGFTFQYEDWLGQICHETQPLSELVPFLNRLIQTGKRDLYLSRKGLQNRPELVTHLKCFLNHASSVRDVHTEKLAAISSLSTMVNVRDATMLIDQLRLIKSKNEARALKRIGAIGARALHTTIEWSRQMVATRPYPFLESHVDAKFAFESKMNGARRLAFPSVVAGGPRATTIHYGRNDRMITEEKDRWVLTDVGCEDVDGYCCDITRTWPLTMDRHRQSPLHTQLYEALIGVQYELIDSIKVGRTTLNDLNKLMFEQLVKILSSFSPFQGSVSGSDLPALIKRICPHHVSHYLGLDVHDTPSVSRSVPLVPGMCFTIEPGLYFPMQSSLPIKSEFRNIGLRLEDDILIDPITNEIVILTADCPSRIERQVFKCD